MELAVNLADTTFKIFSENMGHPEPTKIEIIKMSPTLLKIYGIFNFISQTNGSNYSQFKEWADSNSYHQVELLSDGSTCNEVRHSNIGSHVI